MTFQLRRSGPSQCARAYRFPMFCYMVLIAGISAGVVNLSSPASAASLSEVELSELELSELEQRGEYLAAAGNCVSCHTNGDDSPFAGGLEFETPYGTIVSTNITSDPEAGIVADLSVKVILLLAVVPLSLSRAVTTSTSDVAKSSARIEYSAL